MTNYNRYQSNESNPTRKQREKLFLCMQQILRMIINNKDLFFVYEDELLYETETHLEAMLIGQASGNEQQRLEKIFETKNRKYAWRKLSELVKIFLQNHPLHNKEHILAFSRIAHHLSIDLKRRLKHPDFWLEIEEARERYVERE